MNKDQRTQDFQDKLGIDLSKYKGINKRQVLRNCVQPDLGLYIFEQLTKGEEGVSRKT